MPHFVSEAALGIWKLIHENCDFISPTSDDISVIITREPLGTYKAIVVRINGKGKRDALLSSNSAGTMQQALELLLIKSADAVQNYITTNGFEIQSTKKVGDASDDDGSEDSDDDDASFISSSLVDEGHNLGKWRLQGSFPDRSEVESTYDSANEAEDHDRYFRARGRRTSTEYLRMACSPRSPKRPADEPGRHRSWDLAVNDRPGPPRKPNSKAVVPNAAMPQQPPMPAVWRAAALPPPFAQQGNPNVRGPLAPGPLPPPTPILSTGARPFFNPHRGPAPPVSWPAVGRPPCLQGQQQPPAPSKVTVGNPPVTGVASAPNHAASSSSSSSSSPSSTATLTAGPSTPPPQFPMPPTKIDYRLLIKVSCPNSSNSNNNRGPATTCEAQEHRIVAHTAPTRRDIRIVTQRYILQNAELFRRSGLVVNEPFSAAVHGIRIVVTRAVFRDGRGEPESYELAAYDGDDFGKLCAGMMTVTGGSDGESAAVGMPLFEVVVSNVVT